MRTAFVLSFGLLIALHVQAQSCDCPAAGTCFTCSGGISSFTLRYNGSAPKLIDAADQGGTVFSQVVNPNSTFSFLGTTPNDKFLGLKVDLTIAGVADTSIPVNCGSVFVGDTFGSFTVTAANSKTGGVLCCSTANSDTTPPQITNCPANIVVEAEGSCEAIASWTPPTAGDNCSVTLSTSHEPGSTFALGTTVVTYTASDPQGNQTTCTFNVVVGDTKAPVANSCPANITVTVPGCESVVSWTPPTFDDNCDITLVASHDPGNIFQSGTTDVTYTATDESGNSATCSFTVTVAVNGSPAVSGCPGDITLHTSDNSIVASWTAPQATPVCGTLTSTASHQPGDQFGAGVTEVVYEFSDDTGHKASCKFNVNVIKDDVGIEVSKALTPNGDGINDTWELTNIEKFKDNKVFVVDRWGNKVYQGSGYDNSSVLWNGVGINGSKVPVGTYFYTVEVRFNGSVVRETGFIEVVY